MALLDNLQTEVEETTSVVQSAVTLIEGLSAQIKAAGTDPVKLKALTAQLDKDNGVLAAAVVANTPSDPETPPVDPPVDPDAPTAERSTRGLRASGEPSVAPPKARPS